ncbi:hypothetical protein BOTBODRAFT_311563 [Botryobasidium botryosum FD-172 SS1]|uniref:Uncharacterized protein n=1 Tax=Botryobasidium botryosum (strain FD-172 SS1) TaxID=930990 RepID=A0A067MXS5_BOTB1|nr:hypothetical protein BOTBODRAFT_311563 [Botryobasidium botryosum FD-172 SS1]
MVYWVASRDNASAGQGCSPPPTERILRMPTTSTPQINPPVVDEYDKYDDLTIDINFDLIPELCGPPKIDQPSVLEPRSTTPAASSQSTAAHDEGEIAPSPESSTESSYSDDDDAFKDAAFLEELHAVMTQREIAVSSQLSGTASSWWVAVYAIQLTRGCSRPNTKNPTHRCQPLVRPHLPLRLHLPARKLTKLSQSQSPSLRYYPPTKGSRQA